MQSYSISFELNELPPSPNKYLRMHYHERNKIFSSLKIQTWKKVKDYLPLRPLTKYQIICTRYTIRPLDPFDNLPGSFKCIIDALTSFKIIEDDKWTMGEMISARQVKVKHKKDQKITIQVLQRFCNV